MDHKKKKLCKKCGVYRFIDEFYKTKHSRDGHVSRCKECYREERDSRTREQIDSARLYQKQYNKTHKKIRAKKTIDEILHNKYGIEKEDYDRMLASQKGGCAICGKPPTERRMLCVDHNHRTGEIRGILCNKCNLAIGYLEDDYDNAIVSAFYLMNHEIKSHRTITHQEFLSHASGYLDLFYLPFFTDEEMQRRGQLAQLTPLAGDTVAFMFGPYIVRGLVIEDRGIEHNGEQIIRVRIEPIDNTEPLETEIPARIAKIVSSNRQL